jgi:hypothetical protein
VEDLQAVFSLDSKTPRVLTDEWGNELFEYTVSNLSEELIASMNSAQQLRVQPVAHLDRFSSLAQRPFVFVRPLSTSSSSLLQLARFVSLLINESATPVFVHRAGLLHSAAEWSEHIGIYDHSVALFNLFCSVEVTTTWPLGLRSQGMAAFGLPDVLVLSNSDDEFVVQAVVRAAVDSIKKSRGHTIGEKLSLPVSVRADGVMECRHNVCEGIDVRSGQFNPHGWTIIGTAQQIQRFEGGDRPCSQLVSSLRSRSIRERKAAVQGLKEPMFALESVRESFRRVLRDSHVPIRLLALVVMDAFSVETLRLYAEELLWLRKSKEELVASTAYDILERMRMGAKGGSDSVVLPTRR